MEEGTEIGVGKGRIWVSIASVKASANCMVHTEAGMTLQSH